MHKAQLERDLIAERVRNGLANAKAKGIRIGRLKTRDSYLIRKLKASGMTHRQAAVIAKCSAGAIAAEMKALKAENLIRSLQKEETTVELPIPSTLGEISLPMDDMKIELDFAS